MKLKLFISTMLACVGISTHASAVTLSECTVGLDCNCSGYSGAGFDECNTFTTPMDPGNPATVRSAFNLSYTTSGGQLDSVEVELNNSQARILTTMRASWVDRDDINDYLNELVFGSLTPPAGVDKVDICDFDTFWNNYKQGGSIGRFDVQSKNWASSQFQNAILSVLANADGEIVVDDIVVAEVVNLSTPGCATGSHGGLEVEQCSNLFLVPNDDLEEVEEVCGEEVVPNSYFLELGQNVVQVTDSAETELEFGIDQNDEIFVVRVPQADRIEVFGLYYTAGAASILFDGETDPTRVRDYDAALQSHRAYGTCGYSETIEGSDEVVMDGNTAAGDVPQSGGYDSCPSRLGS